MRTSLKLMTAGAMYLLIVIVTTASDAEDVVIVNTETGQRRRTGRVVDYTGRGLVLETPAGQRVTIKPSAVERIETERQPKHRAILNAIRARQFDKAAQNCFRLLDSGDESRPWVQRELAALMIQCEHASGRHQQAAKYFGRLLRNDSLTPHFHTVPLAWTAGQRMEPKLAQPLLSDPRPAMRLIAASYLLATRHGAATQVLQQLAEDTDRRIAHLAQAQLFRNQTGKVADKDVALCRQAIEALPQNLRAGPYYVLGRLHAARDEHQRAAVALMHVPILYPHQVELSAESLLAAAKSLTNAELPHDAIRVYQELVDTYPNSTAAAEAKQLRTQLSKDS